MNNDECLSFVFILIFFRWTCESFFFPFAANLTGLIFSRFSSPTRQCSDRVGFFPHFVQILSAFFRFLDHFYVNRRKLSCCKLRIRVTYGLMETRRRFLECEAIAGFQNCRNCREPHFVKLRHHRYEQFM